MHTRHGVQVIPTGLRAHRETRRRGNGTISDFIESKDGAWVQVQIMPPIPQRIEWVHKDNLRDTSKKIREPDVTE